MDHLQVAVHVARLGETPLANGTRVRLFSRVRTPVFGISGKVSKTFITNRTVVRFLPSVNPFVRP